MVRQRRSKIKGHKYAVTQTVLTEAERTPGSYLDRLNDRELGKATRGVINKVLRPGMDTASEAESRMLRYILEEIEIEACFRMHGGSKWIGNRAIQMVAAVLRREHEGKGPEQACNELAADHELGIDTSTPIDAETVLTTFKRARKHLASLDMLEPVRALLRAERVHAGIEPWPESPISQADRELLTLPPPLLPPDFPKIGNPLPAWQLSHHVEQFLYRNARHKVLSEQIGDKKRKKTRKRVS